VEVRDGVSLAALGAFLAVWLQNRWVPQSILFR
jgi:hypothetical protein